MIRSSNRGRIRNRGSSSTSRRSGSGIDVGAAERASFFVLFFEPEPIS